MFTALGRFVNPESFRTKVSFPTLFFTAGVIGIGAVVAQSGLGGYVADLSLGHLGLSKASPLRSFATLSGLTLVLNMFATQPGTVVILTTLAGEAAALTGLSTETVLMTIVHGCGNIFFPYQVGPILVALKLGGVTVRAGVRVLFPLAVFGIAALLPLTFYWWRFLGYV